MAFNYDETNPVDASFIADFPSNEQAARLAVLSSNNVEHYAETTGLHRQVSMLPLGSNPLTSGLNGFTYTKAISGITELFYEDDSGQVIQLTSNGSASPDKLPLAGGTMTGALLMNSGDIELQGTSLLKLLNAKYIQGRDVAGANWRDLVGVDASDVSEFGDVLLGGGLRLLADGVDEAKVEYGSGDKKIWHAGHFATAPIFVDSFESSPITFVSGFGNTEGTVVNGLSGQPKAWAATIRCTSTDLGYPSGAEIPVGFGLVQGTPVTFTVALLNATTFAWFAPANNVRVIKNDGKTIDAAIDDSKWALIIYAWN